MTKREIAKWLEKQRALKWQEAMRDYDLKKAERKAIEDQWTRDKASINVNFDKVIAHVRTMSTAKKAMEYLKELGFNVNELQVVTEPDTLAIAAPVDTSYLFLKKTEEAGEAQ